MTYIPTAIAERVQETPEELWVTGEEACLWPKGSVVLARQKYYEHRVLGNRYQIVGCFMPCSQIQEDNCYEYLMLEKAK